jgi:hypothetical protein
MVRLTWAEISGPNAAQNKCILLGGVKNRTLHLLNHLTIRIRRGRLFSERKFAGVRAGTEAMIPPLHFYEGCQAVMANLEASVTTCKMEGVEQKDCVGTVHFDYAR